MRKLGRKVTIVLLAIMMLVSTTQQFAILGENKASAASSSDFASGSGDQSDPFLIETADQLNAVRDHLGAGIYFELTEDIDLSSYATSDGGEGWTPIGDVKNSFNGTFNGNGKTISNLYINRPTADFQALFGITDRTASISDVNLISVNVTGGSHTASLIGQNNQGTVNEVSTSGAVSGVSSTGGLVGISYSGTIINSNANVRVIGTGNNIGGLIGYSNQGTINNNYAVGNVTGVSIVGGLIGVGHYNASINKNYAVGNVSGENYIGGLIGQSGNNTSLDNNYATGNVTGNAQVGGLIGNSTDGTPSDNSDDEVVTNSFALGNVTGDSFVGGLIGFNEKTVSNMNYATGKVTGNIFTGGLIGYISGGLTTSNGFYNKETSNQSDSGKGEPVSTAEMQLAETYINWNLDGSIWTIDPAHNNGYPYLIELPTPKYASYSGNGNTGGTVPIAKLLRQDQDIIVDDNSGNLTKTGYTFVGWNTEADGSGNVYDPGDTYNGGDDLTLYAVWLQLLSPPVLTADTTDNDVLSDIEITFADDSTWRDEITAIVANGDTLSEENYSIEADKITLFANVLAAATYTISVVAGGYADATVQQIVHPNLNLSSLVLSSGAMTETFTSAKTSYTQNVVYGISSLTVTPTVADSTAIVKVAVNDEASTIVTSGAASATLPLKVGANTITVTVTVGNEPSKVYTVVVTRKAAGGSTPIMDTNVTSSNASTPIIGTNVTSSNGRITIPTGSTGKVTLDNEVTVDIPVNATNKDITITIEKLLEMNNLLANGEILASHVFVILKNFPGNFSKPVTLTFVFDPTKVGSDQRPAVFYYDEVKKVWVEVTGGRINGNRISVEVDHFTKYAVFVVDSAVVVPVPDKPTDIVTEISFSDIAGHWAQASIKQAVNSGIVNGYSDGTFKPNNTVTRAEFAVMLMNTLKPQGNGADLTFTDAAEIGTWAKKAIAQAVQTGIIKDFGDGTFRPGAGITRSEMAMMIANALGQPTDEVTVTGFVDDKVIPNWAKSAVAAMKKLGIITGKDLNKFAPDDHTTRAEAVTVLLKMMEQNSK